MADNSPATDIHIKASRRGEFTAEALKHHEGVQEWAHHVVSDPDASGADKRRAQFAINATKFGNGHPG